MGKGELATGLGVPPSRCLPEPLHVRLSMRYTRVLGRVPPDIPGKQLPGVTAPYPDYSLKSHPPHSEAEIPQGWREIATHSTLLQVTHL